MSHIANEIYFEGMAEMGYTPEETIRMMQESPDDDFSGATYLNEAYER